MKKVVPVACLLLSLAVPAQDRPGRGDVELTVAGEIRIGSEIDLLLEAPRAQAFAIFAATELVDASEDLGAGATLLHLSNDPLDEGFELPLHIPDSPILVGLTVHIQALVVTEDGALGRSEVLAVTIAGNEPQVAFATSNLNYVFEDGGWKDVDTGLVWNQDLLIVPGSGRWQDVNDAALSFVDAEDREDWRLPTVEESLDAVAKGIANCVTEPTFEWTSSKQGPRAWVVQLSSGDNFRDWIATAAHGGRAVRGVAPPSGGGGKGKNK